MKKKNTVTDMTKGSTSKHIFKFAIPILIGNIFQQIYNLADTAIVGKYIDSDALAAVGVTGNITFFMFSLIIGLTGGIAIVMSQYFGAGDIKAVKRTFGTSIYAILGAIIIVTIMGLILAMPLLKVLDTPDNIIDSAYSYLRIIIIGMFAMIIYNWMASVLRALGDSITPLIFLALSSVINIVLDLIFIIKFNMGVEGAAWATVIAQTVSAILCVAYGFWKLPILRVNKYNLQLDTKLLSLMLKVGLPSGIQSSFISVSVMLMQKSINAYGSVVVAGYIGAVKLEQIAMQFGFSVSMATGTFTGQNVGAGKYDRVREGVKVSNIMIAIGCAVLSPLIFLFGEVFMKMFVDMEADNATEVMAYGGEYLRIMAFALVTVGILQVFQQMLRSAGDVSITMIMGFCEVLTRVIIAFTFSGVFGRIGIWWATPITWIVAMIIGFIRYKGGKWERKRLIIN